MRPELQGIVEEAARLLGAPITLEDRNFDLVAYGTQRPDVDAVRQGSILTRGSTPEVREWFERYGIATTPDPVTIPGDSRLGIAPRLCLPARWRGVTYGYVWAYDWTGDVRSPAVRAAADLAEHAGTLLAAQSRTRENAASTLADLLSADADDVTRAIAAVRERSELPHDVPVVVVVAGATGDDGRDLSLNLWRLPRAVLASSTELGTTLLVPLTPRRNPARDADLRPAEDVARRTLDLYAERVADRTSLVAGIGAPTTDLRQARTSWRQARLAVRVARVDPARRPVAAWDDLGVYRLLAADPAPGLVLDAPVRRLLDDPELTRTMRTFLDLAGSVAETAAALGIHRQTLYHRLGRVETLTGLSVKRGEDRLRLHLGLTLAPLLT
ncbi:PucR family transcriptional regulator [Jatrophihabitans sp. YIM 134969]